MISKTPNSLTIRPLFADFFPSRVTALVSTSGDDYGLHHRERPFTAEQEKTLRAAADIDAVRICNVKQVHGSRIIRMSEPVFPVPEADGLLTGTVGLALVVRTADCLPVFFFDPDIPAAALVHAGWRGTYDRISSTAVHAFVENYGSRPDRLKVAFGPCIRVGNYEVGMEFREYFPNEISVLDGRNHFDLVLANRRQLLEACVRPENIFDCGICTYADKHYHSYRRDGDEAGRILSLIMIKE